MLPNFAGPIVNHGTSPGIREQMLPSPEEAPVVTAAAILAPKFIVVAPWPWDWAVNGHRQEFGRWVENTTGASWIIWVYDTLEV